MKVLDRYVLQETLRSLLGLTSILLLTTIGMYLGDTLGDVARGSVPANLLLGQLGLRSLESLTILVPLAVFLAIMLTLGRLYRDSEMVVMSACGFGRLRLYGPLARLAIPAFLLLLFLGLWVSPWADRAAREQIARATADLSVAGLQPGRFQAIAARDSVVYVEAMDRDGRFRNAFVHIDRQGRRDIVTAREGYQYTDESTGARYIALLNGLRTEGVAGQADFRLMRFARNDIRIPEQEQEVDARLQLESLPLVELLGDPGPEEWAELHWRVAPALALLALVAVAVPLSRTRPREGYYGNLVLGIIAYVAYANVLALARSWVERGDVPPWLGLWWLPLCALAFAAWLLRPPSRARHRARARS